MITVVSNIFVVTLVTDFTMVSFVTKVSGVPITTIIAVATMVNSVYWLLWLRERTKSVRILPVCLLFAVYPRRNSYTWHVGLITFVVLTYSFTG